MRQAGRYLPQYASLRGGRSIKQIAGDPVVSSEITYAPIREIGVDAAIVFSDILLPLACMGLIVDYVENTGPVVKESGNGTVAEEIMDYDPSEDSYDPSRTISLFKSEHPEIPVIGFSGGPLTIASYIYSGRSDRDLKGIRKMMAERPEEVREVLGVLSKAVARLASSQIAAGADAFQVFDSWAASIDHAAFRDYFNTFVNPVAGSLAGKVPSIYFTLNSSPHIETFRRSSFNCLSVDWKQDMAEVSRILGPGKSVQGNLDPEVAGVGGPPVEKATLKILDSMKGRDGYVFNLGHGVLPHTDPETLRKIVKEVHTYSGK